ncbi:MULTISPECIES: hypothetical protein [Burkholderia]|uniref:hypothetical protein n=1 Tax=Burkholderia TaxID=32008 RepID=UPI001CF54DEF|nr:MULTISPECIES: hypothetical protein [unclassified Burkholderia]MCA8241330.1 hypothetical protein [Burkholderia sp. AU32262]MDN7698739.1 hypothetical protein [Burkholderia sp. AU44665]
MDQALGNIVANALATGPGGVVGGKSEALSGHNVDRFNRQLHPEEKTLAKQLAEKSKGKYTQARLRTRCESWVCRLMASINQVRRIRWWDKRRRTLALNGFMRAHMSIKNMATIRRWRGLLWERRLGIPWVRELSLV